MARKAREKSESGLYHIVLKGNNRLLFVEDDDYRCFLSLLTRLAERDCAEVYAYCLFSETAHLVCKEGLRPLGEWVKALVSAYAVRCNQKYDRVGKLFYDRFLSEPLESDSDLCDAVRFVHRLPLAYNREITYLYTSYNNYVNKKGLRSDALMLLFDESTVRFKEEMASLPARVFLTGDRKPKLTDAQLIARLKCIAGSMTAEEAERITLPVLGEIACKLQREGAGIRQLSRVLDVSKSVVERALKVYAAQDDE